jgi:hypothetical protein
MTQYLGIYSVNSRTDSVESAIGANAILKIRTGAQPANCAAADAGTVLATLNLPADWMYGASGVALKKGTWEDTSADASGDAGHFRLYASDGITCHMQGSVTATGNGGDLTLDTITIAVGQKVSITQFSMQDHDHFPEE